MRMLDIINVQDVRVVVRAVIVSSCGQIGRWIDGWSTVCPDLWCKDTITFRGVYRWRWRPSGSWPSFKNMSKNVTTDWRLLVHRAHSNLSASLINSISTISKWDPTGHLGGLDSPRTNQRMYRRCNRWKLWGISLRFWKHQSESSL